LKLHCASKMWGNCDFISMMCNSGRTSPCLS
jgi:hypothetical protein